jgi:hypothetical protein
MVILNFKQNVKTCSNKTIEIDIKYISNLEFICGLDVKNKNTLKSIKKKKKPKPKIDHGATRFDDYLNSSKHVKNYKHDIDKFKTMCDKYYTYDID